MNFFTRPIVWTNWQFSLLKLAMLALGILLGAGFPEFWRPILWLVCIVFLVAATWVTVLWLRAMRLTASSALTPR